MSTKAQRIDFNKEPDLVSVDVEALTHIIALWLGQNGEKTTVIESPLCSHHGYKQGKPLIDPRDPTNSICHHQFSDEWLSNALDLSNEHPEVFDFLVEMGAGNLITEGPLPSALKRFLGLVLFGAMKRPRGKGRSKAEFQMRDFAILEATKEVLAGCAVRFDKSNTSNSICAKDLVAMAFDQAGFKEVTGAVIKNVWQNRNKSGGREQEYLAFVLECRRLKVPKK